MRGTCAILNQSKPCAGYESINDFTHLKIGFKSNLHNW